MKLSALKRRSSSGAQAKKCLRKFLYYFPGGFSDVKYISWERDYKWKAHAAWEESLNKNDFRQLLRQENYREICKLATAIESRTNLLFSFEKMALRDAVKEDEPARLFANGLFNVVYGTKKMQLRFEQYRDILSRLPVKQTRVLTWPLQTVFNFIADPSHWIFLKPMVTKKAAAKYGFDFTYSPKPNWNTYAGLLQFAEQIRNDIGHLEPRDMIDIQSFIWVLGSEEYPD